MTDRELMQQALEALIGARAFLESDAPVEIWGVNDKAITALRERLAQPEQWEQLYPGLGNPFQPQRTHWEGCEEVHPECQKPGCAECGKSGGWALYCVECMEKLIAVAEREPLLDALTAICVKCRSNEWGPTTPRKEILNWMHDHASVAIAKLKEKNA